MAWQQQRQHDEASKEGPPQLSRLQIGQDNASSSMPKMLGERQQMGPPSQTTLPSLNFRQLAPLRSPNLPSHSHSNNYFSQKRNRSTSESVANDALRTLQYSSTSPPRLPEPPTRIQSSTIRGEPLPPLAAFGHSTSPSPSYRGAYRSMKPSASTSAIPTQYVSQPFHHQLLSPHQQVASPSASYSQHSTSHRSPSLSPRVGYYSTSSLSSRSQGSALSTSLQDTRFFTSPISPPAHGFEHGAIDHSRESSETTMDHDENSPRKLAKSHVPSACLNCKRAHLACDVSRPCRRCINLGKTDTCVDVQHKKRGRPRLRDREAAAIPIATDIGHRSDQRGHHHHHHHHHNAPVSSDDRHYKVRGSGSSASAMKVSPRSIEMTSYFPPASASSSYDRPSLAYTSSYSSVGSEGRNRSISSASLIRPRGMTSSTDGMIDESMIRDDTPSTVSLILSTDLRCVRCSEESFALLGYTPSDLMERSLIEIVHHTERDRLEALWTSLIEPVGVKPTRMPANIHNIMSLSPAILMTPASGTVYMQESMRLCQRSGIYDFYSIRLHLGGGLGADLYQPSTLDRSYIVASLLKLGNDASHPDPNMLREGRWHLDKDPRVFTSPQSTRVSASANRGSILPPLQQFLPPPAPPPPSAPPSYHSTGVSNEESSRRGSLAGSTLRSDWDRSDLNNKQTYQMQGLKESSPPAPPVYSRTISTQSISAVQPVQQDFSQEMSEKQPRSTQETSSAGNVSLDAGTSPSNLAPKANATTKNGARVTSMPFSYTNTRSETGGITC